MVWFYTNTWRTFAIFHHKKYVFKESSEYSYLVKFENCLKTWNMHFLKGNCADTKTFIFIKLHEYTVSEYEILKWIIDNME